jgi:hypothetical protein
MPIYKTRSDGSTELRDYIKEEWEAITISILSKFTMPMNSCVESNAAGGGDAGLKEDFTF